MRDSAPEPIECSESIVTREVWRVRGESFGRNLGKMIPNIKVLLHRPKCSLELPGTSGNLIDKLRQSGCNVITTEELTADYPVEMDKKLKNAANVVNPDIVVCVVASERCKYSTGLQVRPSCISVCSDKMLRRFRFCVHARLGVCTVIPACFNTNAGKVQYCEFYDEGEGLTLPDRILQTVQNEVVRQYCPPDLL